MFRNQSNHFPSNHFTAKWSLEFSSVCTILDYYSIGIFDRHIYNVIKCTHFKTYSFQSLAMSCLYQGCEQGCNTVIYKCVVCIKIKNILTDIMKVFSN